MNFWFGKRMSIGHNARDAFVQSGEFEAGRGRVAELDAFRGICVLMVVLDHYFTATGATSGVVLRVLTAICHPGWMGVDLFFVLSGFLIGSILLRNQGAENFFSTFYIRRFARLTPVYFTLCLLYVGVYPLLIAEASPAAMWLANGDAAPPPVWSYFAYVQNFYLAAAGTWGPHWLAPSWSLAVEEQFYLLAPVLIYLLPRERLQAWLFALILASIAWRISKVFVFQEYWESFLLLPSRADSLLVGILGAHYCSSEANRTWLASNAVALKKGLAAAVAIVIAMPIAGWTPMSFAMVTVGHTMLALAGLAVIFAAIFANIQMFRNAWLVGLGGISYGVYLIHEPVHGLVFMAAGAGTPDVRTWGDVGLGLIAFTITIAVAHFSAVYFERPIVALAHRVKYRRGGPISATAVHHPQAAPQSP